MIQRPDVTLASNSVQSVIKSRVGEDPEKAKRNVHRVRVRVPVSVAQVLISLIFHVFSVVVSIV